MDEAFGHWLAGFVDGEGHFSLRWNQYGKSKKPVFKPSFRINLRWDDAHTLVEIQRVLGGNTYFAPPSRRPVNSKPQCNYVLSDKKGLLLLIETFRRYPLRSKKRRDFEIWAPAVEGWASKRSSRQLLRLLSDELVSIRQYRTASAPPRADGPQQASLWELPDVV